MQRKVMTSLYHPVMSGFSCFLRLLLLSTALLIGGQAIAAVEPALRDLAVLVDPLGEMDITAVESAADQRFNRLRIDSLQVS